MSALAEALLAAQRQAVGALSKAYVAGLLSDDGLATELDKLGLRDEVDQGLLIQSLGVVRDLGSEAPKPTGTTEPKMPEQASDGQKRYIADLCKKLNVPEPDTITSKERASEIIEALKAGTYNADAEYAYALQKCGESFFERAYGIEYRR